MNRVYNKPSFIVVFQLIKIQSPNAPMFEPWSLPYQRHCQAKIGDTVGVVVCGVYIDGCCIFFISLSFIYLKKKKKFLFRLGETTMLVPQIYP